MRTTIALIAHDRCKPALVDLARDWHDQLASRHVVATSSTGALLREELGLEVTSVASGPYGGDLEIGVMVTHGEVGTVIFLRDPLTHQPHEADVQALLRICDLHGVPSATNVPSAQLLLRGLFGERRMLKVAV